jgi:circadian clock protein KaiC
MRGITPARLERVGTGSAELDEILGGGLPSGSVTVIAGEPGSGKTVFTLQLLFHLARQGKKALYFTTLSEPALKLIRYMQLFTFFDADLLDHRIIVVDLASAIRAQNVQRALAEVTARVEREEPDLVAIDSFKAIHDLLGEPRRSRCFVYDLAVHIAGWGGTTLLVGEYTAAEISGHPEFAIADGIVRLSSQRQELTSVRSLEVLKLRGANYVSGQHFFEIGPDGVTFYPRVRGPAGDTGSGFSLKDKLATGVPGLDECLRGGLPRGSTTIVEGGTGTGKTLLGLHFLLEGARAGEPGLLLTLEETPGQLRDITAAFGWDLATLEAEGRLVIDYTSPVELSTDRFLNRARQLIHGRGIRRAVLDSLTSAALGVLSDRRFRELIHALGKHSQNAGVTLLMTQEVPELLGSGQVSGHGVSTVADNIILLRYVECDGRLERAISVLKARGVNHDNRLYRAAITARGFRLDSPFRGLRGVLTGVPSPDNERTGPSRPARSPRKNRASR